MAWLLICAQGAEIEARDLEVVAFEGEHRLDLPASGELRVGRLVPGRQTAGEGPRLRIRSITLSREHCVLFEREGRWYVRDAGSTGGTFLNGGDVRLNASDEVHLLVDGDVLHLGAPIGAPFATFKSA